MVKEIEKSILYVVHKIHFTANRLAIINILYNSEDSGMDFSEIGNKMPDNRKGKTISGTLSKLAQDIDELEKPGDLFGFTGYTLLFEKYEGELHRIRPEFRNVIDHHPTLRNVMQIPVEQIYIDFQKGLYLP